MVNKLITGDTLKALPSLIDPQSIEFNKKSLDKLN